LALLAAVAACGGTPGSRTGPPAPATDDDGAPPPLPTTLTYQRPQLATAHAAAEVAAQAAEAARDAATEGADLPALILAARVLRNRVSLLAQCAATAADCPPILTTSLPVPAIDPDDDLAARSIGDVAAWRAWATAAYAEACACATIACVDGWTESLRRHELGTLADLQGDELAAQAITTARVCLTHLRQR